MNVSLRSQMVAGVAALGAAAVVIAPITQPDLMPSTQRVAVAFELSALVNPLTAIGAVIADVNTDIFNQGFVSEGLVWPDSFYGEDFLYAPLNLGIIPDLANQFSTGPLVGLVNNLSGYLWAANRSAIVLGGGVAASAFNTPFALVTAVQELIAGDPEAALETLVTEIIGPLQLGLEGALAGVGYIVDNVINSFQTIVTNTLPYLVSGVLDAVVGGLTYVVSSAVATVGQVVADLGAGQFEDAWNAAVNGFLGRDGTLGQIETLALGVGIVADVDSEPTVVVPSLRSVLTSEIQRLGGQKSWGDGGITNEPFDPPVPGPTAAVAVSAPAAVLESAPATPEVQVEAPAPVSEPDVKTAVADVAPAAQVEAPAQVSEAAVTSDVTAVTPAAEAPSTDAATGTPKKTSHRVARKAASAARGAN